MDAAAAITRARRAAGLSKRELARRARTSPAALVAYESGERQPTTGTLERIIEAAGFRGSILLTPMRRRPDPERAGRLLEQVLALAAHLPTRPARRTLPYPPFGR